MDVQLVLAVNLMAISALSLFSALMQRRRDAASFGFVNLLVLAIGAATLYFAPESAGVVVALFFVPFVAAPTIFGALQGGLLVRRTTGDPSQLKDVVSAIKLQLAKRPSPAR